MSIKDLINKAKETANHNEVTKGGDYTPPAAGVTFGRFIEYIELGSHIKKFEGKDKPTAPQARLVFELVHPKNIREVDVEGGGKKKIAERISVEMPLSTSEKSKFYKLFKTMQAGRNDITHIAEMLGEGFILEIFHNTSGEGKDKKTFANIYKDGTWHVRQPVHTDVITQETTKIAVPEPLSALKIFLWEVPTQETWDSLFIDGEREEKAADGTVTKVSNNWLQERIVSATNFHGSALEAMLNNVDNLPTTGGGEAAPEAKQETKEVKVEQSSAQDALAALGLG